MSKAQIQLRLTSVSDLEQLFLFQLNEEANHLAAFTAENYNDKSAYLAKFTKLLSDPTVHNQTILADNKIVGSIAKFIMEGDAEITYWIDRNHWGQGVASKALTLFLEVEHSRPLFGRVAFDNIGSQKVLEKCGFVQIGTDTGFARARNAEIEEYIYKLM